MSFAQLLWVKILAGILQKHFASCPLLPAERLSEYVSVGFELNLAKYRERPEGGRGRRAVHGESKAWRGASSQSLSCSTLPHEVLKLLWKQEDSISSLLGDYISPQQSL